MPTRKELLENLEYELDRLNETERDHIDALEHFGDNQTEASYRIENALEAHSDSQIEISQRIERSNEKHSDSMINASENIKSAAKQHGDSMITASENIQSAAGTVLAGLLGLGALFLTGMLIGKVIETLIDKVKEVNKKTDLIKSVLKLQETHDYLTYNFVIERSYAENTDKEERQNILNGLIADGIITNHKSKNKKTLRIEKDNPELIAHWEWIDSIGNEAQDYLNKNK